MTIQEMPPPVVPAAPRIVVEEVAGARHSPGRNRTAVVARIVLWAGCVLYAVGAARLIGLPVDTFVANVIVDDAIYYAVPARHLLAGQGYTLDKERPTNGVQPLWALVTIGLAAVVSDEVALLRAMVGVSGACWLLAGLVLYRALRGFGAGVGGLAAVGWLMTGFWNRLAFQGMENGLHGLTLAGLLLFGAVQLRRALPTNARSDAPFYLVLGILLALVTLARLDSGILAVIVGALVLFGVLRADGTVRFGWNLRGALLTALPGVVLVGGYLILNLVVFGTLLPISGSVKMHYYEAWEPRFASVWEALAWHARYLFDISTSAPAEHIEKSLWQGWILVWPARRTRRIIAGLMVLGALVGAVRLMWRWHRGRRFDAPGWPVFLAALAVFVVIHFAVLSIRLQHFTPYCVWYFAPQVMAFWVAAALCTGALRWRAGDAAADAGAGGAVGVTPGGPRLLAAGVGAIVVAASIVPTWSPPALDPRTSQFLVGARWLSDRLPAGTRIGAFSAGILAYFARDHQVINFDGLMNDRDYLDGYLSKNAIPAYARQRGVSYLADYADLKTWASGGYWGFRTGAMQLVRWWRMEGDLGYGIWRLFDAERERDVLDPCEGYCDRLSQVRFAAEVLGRFPLVPEAELEAFVGRGDAEGLRLIDSVVEWPSGLLRHVFVPVGEVASLGLTEDRLDIPNVLHVVFGGAVELIGVECPRDQVRRGERLVLRRFWRRVAEGDIGPELVIETRLGGTGPTQGPVGAGVSLVLHTTHGCHETFPVAQWPAGEIVVDTISPAVPDDLAPGSYGLYLGIREGTGAAQAPSGLRWPAESAAVFVGNLRVE